MPCCRLRPAGYIAGVYASRAMLESILVQGVEPVGQLTTTNEVENWPSDTEVRDPDASGQSM